MKNDKKNRGSIFSLLLRNYVLFTLLLILAISGIIVVSVLRITGVLIEFSSKEISQYQSSLSTGRYNEFPVERLLGKEGYIDVVSPNGEIIYHSNKDKPIDYFTKGELEYIPLYENDNQIEIKKLTGEENQILTSVSFRLTLPNGNVKDEFYIFDENLNVLYSTVKNHKTRFSQREYALLTNSLLKDYSIKKYSFKNQYDEIETMLLYSKHLNDNTFFGRIGRTLNEAIWGFVIIYFVVIGGFIVWLNNKVRKPLCLLKTALLSLAEGNRDNYLDYKGPKEFVEICESFNKLSLQLYESEKKQEKLQQEKQKILADISHDLKTPITVIQGYANAINDGVVSDEEKPQYISSIAQKASALNELINIFYEYSKMEHPDYCLTLETMNICVFLRDYMAKKYNEYTLVGHNVEVDIPEEHILCRADRVQLPRAFDNILNNAVKHNNTNVTLFCTLRKKDNTIHITLADNGIGISPELREGIFEPFTVGEKSRNHQGSGLGLSISKKIIEAHGGRIYLVEPRQSKYSAEFEIVLPILDN